MIIYQHTQGFALSRRTYLDLLLRRKCFICLECKSISYSYSYSYETTKITRKTKRKWW